MSRTDKTQEHLKAAIQMASQGHERATSETEKQARSPIPGAPRHPIRSMQGPFEESIEEATSPPDTRAQETFNKLDPRKRRQRLLDTDTTNGTYNEHWRTQSSTAQFHPLTKIISQIAFGVHLLHQQLAKSDEEVVNILQKHVDDVDNFVQRAEEDIDLAITDIRERINYLKLPLEHKDVFDVMLDDKKFRNQIMDGNEKIEVVVNRTAELVKDLQVDVQKAVESTIDMGKYLDDISDGWPQNDRGSIEIFRTMQANVEGWVQCMGTLQMKGNGLSVAVVQLGTTLDTMAKRAASASRREQVGLSSDAKVLRTDRFQRRADRANRGAESKSRPSSQHRHANSSLKQSDRHRSQKPLPSDPDTVALAVEATIPGAKLPPRESLRREKNYDAPRAAPSAPSKSVAGSIKSAKSAKSTKSTRQAKKPPPIRIDKMPTLKKIDTMKSETKRSRIVELANVFRFHGSAAPSPQNSPKLPPPSFPVSQVPTPLASPKLTSPQVARKPIPKTEPVHVEADSNILFELDNEAQATLIEARSKLREQQSHEVLSARLLHTPKPDEHDKGAAEPDSNVVGADATDSAYASSPEMEQPRPLTSPAPRTPASPGIGSLGIFPSASMTSLPSMINVEQDRPSDKESVTALPVVSSPRANSTQKAPSRLRHGSVPNVLPTLKKRTSFSALKRLFQRRSASAEPRSRARMDDEKENRAPALTAKKTQVLEDLIELPG
jgi:hypothetical protein